MAKFYTRRLEQSYESETLRENRNLFLTAVYNNAIKSNYIKAKIDYGQ